MLSILMMKKRMAHFADTTNQKKMNRHRLIQILRKPMKTHTDAEVIIRYFSNKDLKFILKRINEIQSLRMIFNFNTFISQYRKELLDFCKSFYVAVVKKGKCIIKQHDKSDGKMYCILDGKVGIFVNSLKFQLLIKQSSQKRKQKIITKKQQFDADIEFY